MHMNELLCESVFVLCDLMRFFCYKIVDVVAYQATGMLSLPYIAHEKSPENILRVYRVYFYTLPVTEVLHFIYHRGYNE